MAHYKDSKNKLYFLDDDQSESILPSDCKKISDKEASTIREKTSKVLHDEHLKSLSIEEQRFNAYPPMSDYLDAIVKGDEKQLQKYIDTCKAVKEKYPKINNEV